MIALNSAKSKKCQRMAQSVASQAVLCLFCRAELPKSSQRGITILHQHRFKTSRSDRESDLHGEKVRTCKPSFNKLEKGLKGLDTVKETIDEIRV